MGYETDEDIEDKALHKRAEQLTIIMVMTEAQITQGIDTAAAAESSIKAAKLITKYLDAL